MQAQERPRNGSSPVHLYALLEEMLGLRAPCGLNQLGLR